LSLLVVNPIEVLNRINIPKLSLERLISSKTDEFLESQGKAIYRRVLILSHTAFSVILKAYVDGQSGMCPFWDHREEKTAEQ
jgi:hypothetical protein